MAKVTLYNKEGKGSGELELNDAIFGVKVKKSVLHQVYNAIMGNARQPWADTKDKSEVRGGGKKPWKQKGTGRARHGSIRSPLWKGGGVTFGPLSIRNYTQKINKKMNQAAVKMGLSAKVSGGMFIAIESLESDGKTKGMVALRNILPGAGKSTLIVMAKNDDKVAIASRNIQKLDMQQAKDLNVVDLMNHQYIIAPKAAIDVLEKRFV